MNGAQLVDLGVSLRRVRNADGGWPYQAAKRSRIEPTCWALLALGRGDAPPDTSVFDRWPRKDGWLVDVAGAPTNHAFNAMAALTLLALKAPDALVEGLIALLLESRGIRTRPFQPIKQDGSLQAWSWVDGTLSWVEPTAWSLLLLKQRRAHGPVAGVEERIRVGEQMLVDRACRTGGWNYGNSNAFGQDLYPYVPTTALALLAMQDRRGDPAVIRGLEWLEQGATKERSLVALSLALICLRVFDRPTETQRQVLATQLANGPLRERSGDDVLGLAMAACAMREAPLSAFTVPKA